MSTPCARTNTIINSTRSTYVYIVLSFIMMCTRSVSINMCLTMTIYVYMGPIIWRDCICAQKDFKYHTDIFVFHVHLNNGWMAAQQGGSGKWRFTLLKKDCQIAQFPDPPQHRLLTTYVCQKHVIFFFQDRVGTRSRPQWPVVYFAPLFTKTYVGFWFPCLKIVYHLILQSHMLL